MVIYGTILVYKNFIFFMYNCLPCFLKCLTDFEMRESVIKLLVLYPPSPPSYTFRSCPKKNESNQYNYQDSHNTSTLENIEKSIGKVKKVELVTTEIDDPLTLSYSNH